MNEPFGAWINYNGESYLAGSLILAASVRGLRYGDSLFETMLVRDGRIRLWDRHFDRLFAGMRVLRYELPSAITPESLQQQIQDLCIKNGHAESARVRLTVFRGEGQLFDTTDNFPQYIIESSSPGADLLLFNQSGLRIGIYPEGRKACDHLSNQKSGNFLLYAQAARYARDHGWDDCLVLNGHGRVADSCIANLFYVRKRVVHTPPLSEGCVAGVMRRYLMERMPGWGFTIVEKPISPEDLAAADEIFLTNAVRTIRWVGEFSGKTFSGSLARNLYELVVREA